MEAAERGGGSEEVAACQKCQTRVRFLKLECGLFTRAYAVGWTVLPHQSVSSSTSAKSFRFYAHTCGGVEDRLKGVQRR